jgi:hypothetical protein
MTDQGWSAVHQSKTYAEALAQRVNDVVLPFSKDGSSKSLFFDRAAGRVQPRLDNFRQSLPLGGGTVL